MVPDSFLPVIPCYRDNEPFTKRMLVSNIARFFDFLGWCSPAIIQMKILLQHLWEHCLKWDEAVPREIERIWKRWYMEFPLLKEFSIARLYFPKGAVIRNVQLLGFCDASEVAYPGVMYIRAIDDQGKIHMSIVIVKTKVTPPLSDCRSLACNYIALSS